MYQRIYMEETNCSDHWFPHKLDKLIIKSYHINVISQLFEISLLLIYPLHIPHLCICKAKLITLINALF